VIVSMTMSAASVKPSSQARSSKDNLGLLFLRAVSREPLSAVRRGNVISCSHRLALFTSRAPGFENSFGSNTLRTPP
jgi:hypothetical protein